MSIRGLSLQAAAVHGQPRQPVTHGSAPERFLGPLDQATQAGILQVLYVGPVLFYSRRGCANLTCDYRMFFRLSGDPVSANPVKSMGEEREFSSFLSCVSLLYTQHIPNLASLLDSLCDLPFDSFSLTSLLHAYGVRVGQVGILYQLSRSAVVKQLLITEALARCCKTLINRKLRNISREMKSTSHYSLIAVTIMKVIFFSISRSLLEGGTAAAQSPQRLQAPHTYNLNYIHIHTYTKHTNHIHTYIHTYIKNIYIHTYKTYTYIHTYT